MAGSNTPNSSVPHDDTRAAGTGFVSAAPPANPGFLKFRGWRRTDERTHRRTSTSILNHSPPPGAGANVTRYRIDIADEQTRLAVDEARLRRAVESILADSPYAEAEISLAVVDDATIHELNRRYLNHDYPTDVISFVLGADDGRLEGEVIVSADMAAATARRFAWDPADELLLYVIHGTLHLVGYDDLEPAARAVMRQRERHYLGQLGLEARYDDDGRFRPDEASASSSARGVSPGEREP